LKVKIPKSAQKKAEKHKKAEKKKALRAKIAYGFTIAVCSALVVSYLIWGFGYI